MFKINDYVVYGTTGVCQITDIERDTYINDDEKEYYVLRPVYDDKTVIKTLVNNPKVVMRAVINKEDVLLLIAAMPNQETIWIDDERERNEKFKTALKSGNNEDWLKIIKTLYLKKEEKMEAGKKLTKTDENIMKIAERQLYEEFAVALNITPDEVLPYILEHIS